MGEYLSVKIGGATQSVNKDSTMPCIVESSTLIDLIFPRPGVRIANYHESETQHLL